MKIHRYLAKDMRQALQQVREMQGPDAVILSSRRTENGVEVVAAIDFDAETIISEGPPSSRSNNAPPANSPSNSLEFARTLQTQSEARVQRAQPERTQSERYERNERVSQRLAEQERRGEPHHEEPVMAAPVAHDNDINTELHTLRRMLESQLAVLAWNDLTRRAPLQTALLKELTQLGFSQQLSAEVVAQLPPRAEWHEAQRMALALVSKRIKVQEERWLEQGGMVAFVGPTGVGKTTLLAKLAARWVLRHGARELALVSADSVRMGAQDQIQNLGRLLGVPTYVVDQTADLAQVLSSITGKRLVLIDTAGFSQRDPRLSAELALLATSHPQLETSLVLAASSQAGSLEETLQRFNAAAPRSVVLTKMDEAASLGGSLSALARHGLPVAYISEGQRIPEDLSPARAHQLIARAVELAKRSGAQADEETLSLRFGGIAHGIA